MDALKYTFDLNERNQQLKWSKLEFGGGKVRCGMLTDIAQSLSSLALMMVPSHLWDVFQL